MSLRASDLYKHRDQLIELKRQSYEKIYERCVNYIKMTAKTGALSCVYEIPEFVFGVPYANINRDRCATYIMNKLAKSNKNIITTFVPPGQLFIDWHRKTD